MDADLTALRLTVLRAGGGASDVELTLPRPERTIAIRIGGGVSKMTIRRPADVPVRTTVHGGVTKLAIDDQRFGAVGGETPIPSDNYAAPDSRTRDHTSPSVLETARLQPGGWRLTRREAPSRAGPPSSSCS